MCLEATGLTLTLASASSSLTVQEPSPHALSPGFGSGWDLVQGW